MAYALWECSGHQAAAAYCSGIRAFEVFESSSCGSATVDINHQQLAL